MKLWNIFILSFLGIITSSNVFSNIQQLRLDPGFTVSIFASDLDQPRQMIESKNGMIFIGERSGQIIALLDSDGNGQADSKRVIADDLTYSTGVSIFEGDLYFSEISKIWKIQDIENWLQKNSSGFPEKILVTQDLPEDKWHGWKWLQHNAEGDIYTNVGAPCNICLSENPQYASIIRLRDDNWEYVARGVRNSVGFDFHPETSKLYFGDNGRDWLGDDSPACELNRVDEDGLFYGFPYQHALNVKDPEYGDLESGYDYVDPILELGAHVAPTGLAFYDGEMFPKKYKNNIFITLHGSWNRSKKVGYKVIRVVLDGEGDVVDTKDFISGWLDGETVLGRPAAPLVISDGSLLISDDKANVIYRITYKQ
ncbi:PQQ-dependent sugar dehydrogenase [Gammaproteobacteria bacterium]|nr:PQQ-dependent sugar dehydrogenase [Gammaproteobacteria bacterium]